MSETEKSMREDLEAAFQTLETGNPSEKETDPKETDPKETDPKETDPKETDPKETDPKDADPKDPAKDAGKEIDPKNQNLDAPASWRPQDRQQWDKIPKDLQQSILNREKAFSIGIQKNAEAAKWNNEMQAALEPYKNIMQMEGATPAQAIEHLARSAAMIRQGTPQQKADLLAYLAQEYQVDLSMLDSALSRNLSQQGQQGQQGQPGQPGQPAQPLPDATEQRISNMEQLLQMQQAQNQQSIQNQLEQDIKAFLDKGDRPFFDDLRETMADFIEIGARQGRQVSLSEAYDLAAMTNPDVQKAMEQQKAIDHAKKKSEEIKKKQAASSSLSGNTTLDNPAGSSKNESLRQTLSRVYSEMS